MIRRVENKTVSDLFRDRYFEIPRYQRPYAWDKDQWEDLFNDIMENRTGYYIGSIICIDYDQNMHGTERDHLIEYESQDEIMTQKIYDVVDGQQRLTTVSILIAALYYTFTKIDYLFSNAGLLSVGSNAENANNYTAALSALKNQQIREPTARISLTSQYNDSQCFSELISYALSREFDNVLASSATCSLSQTTPAFNYFIKFINKEFDLVKYFEGASELKSTDENIKSLMKFFSKTLAAKITSVDVIDKNAANVLFSNLNNRGLKLSLLDLIKNEIVSVLNEEGQLNDDFDDNWKELLGNLDNVDHVKFLRHYLHAIEKERVSESDVFERYETRLNKRLNKALDIEKEYESFVKHSDLYRGIADSDCKINNELFLRLKGLSELGVSAANALLLYAVSKLDHLEQNKKNKFLLSLVSKIESFYVRRHLTGYPNTRVLDPLIVDAIKILDKGGFSCSENFDTLHNELLKNIEEYFRQPNHWASDELVDLAFKGDFYKNQKLARYIFIRLEQENSRDTWQNHSPCRFFERVKNSPKWTVEHIRPQKPRANSDWLVSMDAWKDRNLNKEDYIHTIGNLTISVYNSKLSNRSFQDKKDKPFGYRANHLSIDADIIEAKKWTDREMKARAEWLIPEIKRLFNW